MAKGNRNRQQAGEKIAQARAAEARRRRRSLWLTVAGAVAVVVAAVVGITMGFSGGGAASNPPGVRLAPLHTLGALRPAPAPGPQGPEAVPIPRAARLAGTATAATGRTVDGIECQAGEQTLFHIHAHLTIFINGTPRQVPAGIGIPGAQAQATPNGPFITSGTCFYWLHTHAADGVIHIESPVRRAYTLGQFFDEWGLPLGPGQVGPARGPVTALYNGQVFKGNPRNIPLTAHAQIQLEVGKPLVAPVSITWPSGL